MPVDIKFPRRDQDDDYNKIPPGAPAPDDRPKLTKIFMAVLPLVAPAGTVAVLLVAANLMAPEGVNVPYGPPLDVFWDSDRPAPPAPRP